MCDTKRGAEQCLSCAESARHGIAAGEEYAEEGGVYECRE